MKLEKKIESWVKEALISEEQAKKIIEFEESAPSKSWFLYGIAGIGITAMVAGVVSIVAANWAEIPTIVKLIGYFVAQISLGLGFLKLKDKPGLGREVLLTLFGLMFLAGIGLIGQIYNLQSDGYSALFFCCALTVLAALCAQSRMLPDVWHIGFIVALLIWIFSGGNKAHASSHFLYGVSAIYILYALSFLRRKVLTVPEQFSRASRRWCGKVFIVLTVVANLGWYNDVRDLIQASTSAYLILTSAVVLLFAA